MASRFFGKSKSKDRKDSVRKRFAGYVEGDEDDTEQQEGPSVNPVLFGSGGKAVDTLSVDNSTNNTEGKGSQENGVNLNSPTVNIFVNVGKKSELSYTGLFNNNVSEEPVYQVPLSKELIFQVPSSEEPIYELPPSDEPIYQVPPSEDPIYQVPTSEEPTYEVPTSGEPIYRVPPSEEPKYQVPTSEEPIYEVPTSDELIYRVLRSQEPVYQVPTSEEPIYEVPTSDEPIYRVPTSKEPIYRVPTSKEPIYEVARETDCEHANLKIKQVTDSVFGENYNADILLPDYSDSGEFTESSHLDIFGLPMPSDILKETIDDEVTPTKVGQKENVDTRIVSCTFDSDDDYIDMRGLPHRDKCLSCSVVEDKLRRSYDIISNFRKKLQLQSSRSAPSSPSLGASRNQICEIEAIANADTNVNGDVGPDPIEKETTKRPKSATVAPYSYIQERDLPRRSLSMITTRSFIQYTVEEVVDCFKVCSLHKMASLCKDESLDGEYFKDLSDEDLAQEPFCLTGFHISKVRRIIAGWRPKRTTSYS